MLLDWTPIHLKNHVVEVSVITADLNDVVDLHIVFIPEPL